MFEKVFSCMFLSYVLMDKEKDKMGEKDITEKYLPIIMMYLLI